MDRDRRPAIFLARRISADRRKMERYDCGFAGVTLPRRRERNVHRPRPPRERRRNKSIRGNGVIALRRLQQRAVAPVSLWGPAVMGAANDQWTSVVSQ